MRGLDSALLTVDRWPWQLARRQLALPVEKKVLLEAIVRCAIAFPLVHLSLHLSSPARNNTGGGCMRARMRGITPARPQIETRPLLLDVIEVHRPQNKTGLYSREASIRGNTVLSPSSDRSRRTRIRWCRSDMVTLTL